MRLFGKLLLLPLEFGLGPRFVLLFWVLLVLFAFEGFGLVFGA